MKKITYMLIIVTFILSFGFTFSYLPLRADTKDDFTEEDKEINLNILTYDEEIYNLVKLLVGNKHNITYIVDNKEALDSINLNNYKENILKADLFIYTSLENNDLIKEINKIINTSNTNSINIARGIRPIINNSSLDEEENISYLLGISEYKIALYNIKVALQEKDLNNRKYYEDMYNDISYKLDEIIIKSRKEINKYKDYIILTDTDNFDYLFKDLELNFKKVKSKDELLDLNEERIIFIYNKNNNIEEIKKEISFKCKYIGLENLNDYNTLLNNINLIIEEIKNNSNS